MISGATFRWGTGTGTDVNPVPRMNNVILEVDYQTAHQHRIYVPKIAMHRSVL
jgi:hypothetical protein